MSETFIKERPLASEMTGLSAKGSSSADAPKGEVTVDDATLFLARFAGGALGSFEATRFAAGHRSTNSFEINGSLGSVRFDFERMNELEFTSQRTTRMFKASAASWLPILLINMPRLGGLQVIRSASNTPSHMRC